MHCKVKFFKTYSIWYISLKEEEEEEEEAFK